MSSHFHVILCFYLCSVEGVLLPTEQFPMVCERRQTSRILVHGDMEFGSVRSVAEANFPREIHQVLAPSVHSYECVLSVLS